MANNGLIMTTNAVSFDVTSCDMASFDAISFDVIIVGAGASGLFCAFNAANQGLSVLVLEHSNKVGKKILMSGGGRCNFTNRQVKLDNFVGTNPKFTQSALARFDSEAFLAYIDKHGIAYHEKSHGELFCDDSAKQVVAMLLKECQDSGVVIKTHTSIDGVSDNAVIQDNITQTNNRINTTHRFVVRTTGGVCYGCTYLVVATGGLSIPTMGATGLGYELARQFGHLIVPTTPSLVPFTFSDDIKTMTNQLAGVSHNVSVYSDRSKRMGLVFERPMLFTHRGLSGPAMLQLSNYWQLGEPIFIDLLPHKDAGDYLLSQKLTQPKKRIRTVLEPFFAKNLLLALQEKLWQPLAQKPLADISHQSLIALGKTLNNWRLIPSGTEGYRVAEVTKGGVCSDEISSKTFESKLKQGLYFIGEVIDVAGWLGGYNFQWAWASAYACAVSLGREHLDGDRACQDN